jgi:peptidoglycan/LPS O-acetylase OafA/YrhL
MLHKANYLSAIDGLRALAILLVMIYHFFPEIGISGFVGVDIFFVISGFVITRIIMTDFDSNEFSLLRFYQKRVIRIFPALLVVLSFCLFLGWFILFEDEFYQLATHLLSGIFFVSNFTLFNEVGYFSENAHQKILLNLWSLAIEEQFYIFWPIMLIICLRAKKFCFLITISLIIASFLLNVIWAQVLPEKAFYMPASRIWQLLMGGMLAFTELYLSKQSSQIFKHHYAGLPGYVGLVLISVALICIESDAAYPSYRALLPTLGAFCILIQIIMQPSRLPFLQHPVMIGIGKISYPLYLWHWPLLAFAYIANLNGFAIQMLIITITFVLAYLTYRYIEYPIRFVMVGQKRLHYILLAILVLASLSLIMVASQGAPKRFANQYFHPYKQAQHEVLVRSCNKDLKFVKSVCTKAYPKKPANVVILGDSHASALANGFGKNLKQYQLNLMHLGRIGCPYLPGVDWTKKKEASCAHYPDINNAYQYILEHPEIRHVVLAMRWKNYANDDTGRFSSKENSELKGDKLLHFALDKTIDKLTKAGKVVYLVQTVPDVDVKKCVLRPLLPAKHECNFDLTQYQQQSEKTEAVVKNLLQSYPEITYYRTTESLCSDKNHCSIIKNKMFLYKDSNHLSDYGAEVVTLQLASRINDIEKTMNQHE